MPSVHGRSRQRLASVDDSSYVLTCNKTPTRRDVLPPRVKSNLTLNYALQRGVLPPLSKAVLLMNKESPSMLMETFAFPLIAPVGKEIRSLPSILATAKHPLLRRIIARSNMPITAHHAPLGFLIIRHVVGYRQEQTRTEVQGNV